MYSLTGWLWSRDVADSERTQVCHFHANYRGPQQYHSDQTNHQEILTNWLGCAHFSLATGGY